MTTTLLLVRHGQTEGNIQNAFYGHAETPLTPLGIAQARALSQRLRSETLHAAYASDLSRAHDTARHALEHRSDLAITLDPALREMHYGEWETLPATQIREQYAEHFREFFACKLPAPGGETVQQIRERTAGAVRRIAAAHTGKTVLVVSHGNAIMATLAELLQMPIESTWAFAVSNTSLTRLTISPSGRVTIHTFNDATHTHGLEG